MSQVHEHTAAAARLGAGDGLFHTAAGVGAALLLGVVLMPFRELTTPAHLAWVFMAVIIVAAHLGGRPAAVATALTSALSLDFFLTRPYLELEIAAKNDLVAFAGLAACGLLVASLGASRRSSRRRRP